MTPDQINKIIKAGELLRKSHAMPVEERIKYVAEHSGLSEKVIRHTIETDNDIANWHVFSDEDLK